MKLNLLLCFRIVYGIDSMQCLEVHVIHTSPKIYIVHKGVLNNPEWQEYSIL